MRILGLALGAVVLAAAGASAQQPRPASPKLDAAALLGRWVTDPSLVTCNSGEPMVFQPDGQMFSECLEGNWRLSGPGEVVLRTRVPAGEMCSEDGRAAPAGAWEEVGWRVLGFSPSYLDVVVVSTNTRFRLFRCREN